MLRFTLAACLAGTLLLPLGCKNNEKTSEEQAAARNSIDAQASAAITRFRNTDPQLSKFFNSAVGWAVFPEIAEGAVIIGGAGGKGVLYERNRITGDVTMAAGSIGAQLGGGTFSQIIFFQTPETLASFKNNTFAFNARATAVAVRAGGSAAADYENGVAVFVFNPEGLMAQLSVGGQRFTFTPR